jgi:tetratricopeptide (TPR) repeat protein
VLICAEYGVSIEDLASLAIVTFKIPDLSDTAKRATLPPSQHKPLSTSMLQGCAQMEDPLAIIQILSAVYLSGLSGGAAYKELASFFPRHEITEYRKTLEKLGAKSKTFALGPDALVLQGLFLEQEGNKEKAENLYTEAVERSHFKYNPKSKHPMQLPLPTPWNAIGTLLKTNPNPTVQARAKAYFMRGAVEGDDPIAYYELAAFEDRTDPKWLKYTSKAAASGHLQATVDLAKFYQDASSPDSPMIAERSMKKTLDWLLEWRQGSIGKLALEWLQAASNMGHKPSTLQLADYHESIGDKQGAQEHLEKLMEPPDAANQVEEWPQLVQLAKRRLAGFKI